MDHYLEINGRTFPDESVGERLLEYNINHLPQRISPVIVAPEGADTARLLIPSIPNCPKGSIIVAFVADTAQQAMANAIDWNNWILEQGEFDLSSTYAAGFKHRAFSMGSNLVLIRESEVAKNALCVVSTDIQFCHYGERLRWEPFDKDQTHTPWIEGGLPNVPL